MGGCEVSHVPALLVVVDELDVRRTAGAPGETDSPLVVHPHVVLTGAVPLNFSSRLPGGTRRSLMVPAASMNASLLHASLLSSGLILLT